MRGRGHTVASPTQLYQSTFLRPSHTAHTPADKQPGHRETENTHTQCSPHHYYSCCALEGGREGGTSVSSNHSHVSEQTDSLFSGHYLFPSTGKNRFSLNDTYIPLNIIRSFHCVPVLSERHYDQAQPRFFPLPCLKTFSPY